MKMNKTNLQVYGNHLAIEKYQKKQREMKLLAGVSFFADFIILTPDIVMARSDSFPDCIIYWVLTFILGIVAFVYDSKYANKIKLYEINNYEIETEALERKKKVAQIRHEQLLDYEVNKRITEPEQEIVYSYKYYIVVAFLHILMGIWLIAAMVL